MTIPNPLNWSPCRRSLWSHDHTVTLTLDPTDWHRFRSFADGINDVVILAVEPDADQIVVQCGCLSAEIRDRLHDTWG